MEEGGRDLNRDPPASWPGDRIGNADLCKSGCTEGAAVTSLAGSTVWVWVITAMRQTVIEAEVQSLSNYLGLGKRLQWRMHSKSRTLHTLCRCQRREALKGGNELRTTIWIARVVQCIHAYENVARTELPRPTRARGREKPCSALEHRWTGFRPRRSTGLSARACRTSGTNRQKQTDLPQARCGGRPQARPPPARAASISRTCLWPYLIVRAQRRKPSALASAAAV
jgi:hypothetical protein